jgi:hypothetical protein
MVGDGMVRSRTPFQLTASNHPGEITDCERCMHPKRSPGIFVVVVVVIARLKPPPH